jgi:vacuolar protein sorting-associated protein 13B
VTLTVGNVQLDNQMFSRQPFDFPILLLGASVDGDSKMRLPSMGCQMTDLILDVLKENSLMCLNLQFETGFGDGSSGKNELRSIRLRSGPLAVHFEDKIMYKMAEVMNSFFDTADSGRAATEITIGGKLPRSILVASRNLAEQLSLQEICVEPIDVSLSVHASVKMYIGLDQSPLNFSQFNRRQLLTTNYSLGQMLARHYISGALFRAGWVVGSLDLIGSPAGLTRTLGDGLKDFVSLPYHGLFHGPWAFVGGMANGSTSLIKHVSAGTLTSVTNFASSVSRNMDRLSLDDEHCRRNEISRRERPRGFGQGLLNGMSGVGISLLGAVGGVAHHPISAFIEQGMSPTGVVTGLTRGLVGMGKLSCLAYKYVKELV